MSLDPLDNSMFEIVAYHPTRDAVDVTEQLGLTPALTMSAGDPFVAPELGPVPNNGWFFVGEYVDSDRLRPGSLYWLLSHLEAHSGGLETLVTWGWDIYLMVDLLPDDTRPAIPQAIADKCAALGLRIEFPPLHGILGVPAGEEEPEGG